MNKMFPFHRKHGNSQNSTKKSGKHRVTQKDNDDDEMSEEEYLEYIRNNDNSRYQLTRTAHDRYCNKILREKEEILLSGLGSIEDCSHSLNNSVRLGPNNNNIFKCLLDTSKNENLSNYRESLSMPCSPNEDRKFLLSAENISRRKSDAICQNFLNLSNSDSQNKDDEYILTLKVDNLVSNMEDISFYRIAPKNKSNTYNRGCDVSIKNEISVNSSTDYLLTNSNENCDSYPVEMINCSIHTKPKEVDLNTSINLKKILIGKNERFPGQWLRQCFNFCHIPASRWRLIQIKPGCCGVIAAVEAFLIKSLLFDSDSCKFKEPLRPNQREVANAFIQALSKILWQAGNREKAVLIIPQTINESIEEQHNVDTYQKNGITDSFIYGEYYNYEKLKENLAMNLKYFTSSPNHGYLNFIICVILSKGIWELQDDMDDNSIPLITENGRCSLELVMLLITGQAVSNVFDNDISIDSCLLKGVKRQSDIGFLSLFEHLNTCEVGSFLKSPKFPIWLVNYTDHFTILFSSKLDHNHQNIQQPFVLYHYDSMTAFSCENDIKLVVDPLSSYTDEQLNKNQTDLQLCIRTKWKNAIVIYAENSELFLV